MIKMQILMDRDKIERDAIYDISAIQASLDTFMVEKLGLIKADNGFYLGRGVKSDFSNFGIAYSKLRRQDWFLENVETWLYFNSDSSLNPDDFIVEDFKAHCFDNHKAA
jgi:hypothetical protein